MKNTFYEFSSKGYLNTMAVSPVIAELSVPLRETKRKPAGLKVGEEGRLEFFRMEGTAVPRGQPVLADGGYVFLGRIAHVPVPAVFRIFLRQGAHPLVPPGLGQHGGGSDR